MKYMGSKSRIAKYIVPILQECIDSNNVTTYRVQKGKPLLDEVTRDTYNLVREAWRNGTDKDKYEQWYVGNVGFLASYNGRWFDGGYAKPTSIKTSNGNKTRDYYQESKRNLEKQASDLLTVSLNCTSYEQYLKTDYSGVCFYLDPPYFHTKEFGIATNFNSVDFWNFTRELSKNNYVYISEQCAPDDFETVWAKPVLRSINAQNKEHKTECLFRWKGE